MSVPKLRFKEFNGEWTSYTLDMASIEIIDGDRGANYPNSEDFSQNGYCLFLNAKNVTKNGFVFNEKMFISKEKDKSLRKGKLKRSDIVLTTRGTVGNFAIYNEFVSYENIRINSGMVLIRISNRDILPNYLFLYFGSSAFTKNIKRVTFGSAQPQLTVGEIKKFRFGKPSLPEQTKIANFLTTIDDYINQLTRKHALLTQYKKAAMQQIFSQQLRFKDENGEYFADWEEVKFSNVYEFFNTNSFSRDLLAYDDGVVKNIHYGDIHTKFKAGFFLDKEKVPFIKPDVDISKISKDCYCQEGDVIIADASEDYADVGKAIEIISLNGEKVLAGLHTYIARPRKNRMALGFSAYLLRTEKVRVQIQKLATGVSVLGISKTNFGKVVLTLPSKEEQTKIANFLTQLDQQLDQLQQQIDHVKQYKQGLLQQMFV